MSSIEMISSVDDLNSFKHSGVILVMTFYDDKVDDCKEITDVIHELSGAPETHCLTYASIDVGKLPEVKPAYNITTVPTVYVMDYRINQGEFVGKVEGTKATAVKILVKRAAVAHIIGLRKACDSTATSTDELYKRLKNMVDSVDAILFMNGTPDKPACEYSRRVVELLNKHNAHYSHFDIQMNEEVGQGLKKFYKLETFPQLYVGGMVVGGLDALKDLEVGDHLATLVPKKGEINERCKLLTNRSPVMVFMEGTLSTVRCRRTRAVLEILDETGVEYDTFDVLSDNDVRRGLKNYSKIYHYPLVYVKGGLLGGLSILKGMKDDESLVSILEGL